MVRYGHECHTSVLFRPVVVWFPTRDGVFVSSAGSGAHAELPQGQMDSLLSIISSQRERFRSRNQELEVVSHPPPQRRALRPRASSLLVI